MNIQVSFDYETSHFEVVLDVDVMYCPGTFDTPKYLDWTSHIEEILEYTANDEEVYRNEEYLNGEQLDIIEDLVECELDKALD